MGKRLSALMGAVVTIVLVGPGSAEAATFDVDSTPDVTHVGGCTAAPDDCSLRDAFAAAGASADADDTVSIPAGKYVLTGDILFEDGVPAENVLTIDGAGARTTTIDGAGLDRVFTLGGISAKFSDLTITGGAAGLASPAVPNDGGAIFIRSSSDEVLTLSSVALVGNTASMAGGAISAPPENNGGTTLIDIVVDHSTISGNAVTGGAGTGQGGAIQLFGSLTVTNSTIANNRVENPGLDMGAGIFSSVSAAGSAGNVTLTNSSIVGNSISNPTGTGAGFMMFNPTMGAAGTFTATNTIIAGNTVAGAVGDCSLIGTAVSDNNLSSDSSCQFTDDGSKQATDPLLGALADNGGPTDTLAIGVDSPAFDAGTATGCPADDQRGTTRPQGAACDIGAFEVVPPPPPPPPATKSADIGVSLTANPDRPELGQKVKFSFEVSNAGPDDATDTVVTGKLPGRAKKVNPSDGCKVAKRGKRYRLRCDLGTLATGASKEFSVKVKPKKGVRKPRATIQAASPVSDPNIANNKAKKKVTVERE
jgi:uncharacterized repeat protein (TIGR01451 family)